jgi:hypothetical protein
LAQPVEPTHLNMIASSRNEFHFFHSSSLRPSRMKGRGIDLPVDLLP